MDKRKMIEERQKNWDSLKRNDADLKEIQDETIDKSQHESNNSKHNTNFLNRLTDKLSERIREEIQKEFRETTLLNSNNGDAAREAIEVKMDSYLRAELSTYVCKICYELMKSPAVPILLFPCGHTFCKACVSECKKKVNVKGGIFTCPYCRTPIESSAINQSLKDLIDQFQGKNDKLQARGILGIDELDEVFDVKGKQTVCSRDNLLTGGINHFHARLKSCEMRLKILMNELNGSQEESNKAARKMDVVRKTCDLLEEEKRGVEEKLFQLEEEKQLVESHLQQQYDKLNEARTVKDGYWEREKMLHDTIEGIKEEMEKLSLLMTQK